MRAAILFLVGLLLGACGTHPVPAQSVAASNIAAAVDLASKTVALVRRDSAGGAHAYCSGVWVSETSILTAHHCTEAAGRSFEYSTREDVYAPGELHERQQVFTRRAILYATDEGHDLALLRAFYAPTHGVARPSLATVLPGAFVQTMGHPRDMWWSYSSGDVARVFQAEINDHDILWVQATAPISAGSSGGGLFDDRGWLIGIAHASNPRGQAINLWVHGQYVDALLRRQSAL
jgi:S1-C subfamily serine protease